MLHSVDEQTLKTCYLVMYLCFTVFNRNILTSIVIISLELCLWTLGCWTLTATVRPSCNTALWTWAKEAAPWGFSSKETNNSDNCKREERGREQSDQESGHGSGSVVLSSIWTSLTTYYYCIRYNNWNTLNTVLRQSIHLWHVNTNWLMIGQQCVTKNRNVRRLTL